MDDEEFKRRLDLNTTKAREELRKYQQEASQVLLTHDISYMFAKLKLDLALQ
jgi:hypothetical protein